MVSYRLGDDKMSRFVIIQADNAISAVCAKILSTMDDINNFVIYKDKYLNNFDTSLIEEGDRVIIVGYSYTESEAQLKTINTIENNTSDKYHFIALHGKYTNNPSINVVNDYSSLISIILQSAGTDFADKGILDSLYRFSHNEKVQNTKSIYSILGCLEYTKIISNEVNLVPLHKNDNGLIEMGTINSYPLTNWYYDTHIKPNIGKRLYDFGKVIPKIDAKVFVLNSDADLNVFKLLFLPGECINFDMIIQPKGFNVSRDNVLVLVIPLNRQVSDIIEDDNKFATDILSNLGFKYSKVGEYTGYTIMPVSFTGLFI